MVDQVTRPPDTPVDDEKEAPPSERKRRTLLVVLAVVVGFVIYSFAFDKTDVDLGEIQSETRQTQLTRILRALARPALVEYDTEEEFSEVAVAVPCGPTVDGVSDLGDGRVITVSPACAAPGEQLEVVGTGFEPLENVIVDFVPDADIDITLTVARIQTDDEGTFRAEFDAPDRTSEEPQAVRVVFSRPIGSWGDRQEVWTDANENGIREVPEIGADGTYVLATDLQIPDVPGIALIDSGFTVASFVSFGDAFEAVAGLANGEQAEPLSEAEGDVVATAAGSGEITVEGSPGTDITRWRVAVYDAADGSLVGAEPLADVIDLSPRISQTTIDTWDKIIETVALALVATTAGLLLAVPLSFLAARNVMRDISSTVTNLTLSLIGLPIGAWAGLRLADGLRTATDPLRESLGLSLAGLVLLPIIAALIIRQVVQPDDHAPVTPAGRATRRASLVVAGIVGIAWTLVLSEVLDRSGSSIEEPLGAFGFLGGFLGQISELIDVLTPGVTALVGAGVLATLSSRLGYILRSRLPRGTIRPLDFVFAAVAGALWFLLIGAVLDWFYRFDDPRVTVTGPAILGAVLGLWLVARNLRSGEIKIGLTVYYVARTIFNTLRSIEPLVMVIVFAVWVGFGPFAGSLALALHTSAALAKLYSEQVESISQGPIEAIRATGATRLQTVVYGVVPQVIPPYISFTMYRWDINVRMSTILGFAGGGGIGFILAQNVNLLQYRDAAVQMLAIAIVVASMDYLSARLRERLV